ncbi:MAG: TIGR02206 family membrane protein [Gammaproteobacteria bacterium]|nr:TIGR02206 family membrane protein [Gammaproteobacteria bacterium]NNM21201.1 TIGR02206 family membrane protein [Gammaproteobacteria bacterium]
MNAFVTFGTGHLATAGVAIASAVIVPLLLRNQLNEAQKLTLGRGLAALLVVHEGIRIALRSGVYDQPLIQHLPLHLCGAVLVLGIIMLWLRSYRLYEIVYFWGIGGLTAAMLTPDIPYSFPHPLFIVFFTGHGLELMAIFYATLVYGFAPRLQSIGKAFAALVLYAAIIFPVNQLLGANYLYLARKPAQASPIDFLGPWPWYIAGLAVLTLLICLLAWLPFALRSRLAARQ